MLIVKNLSALSLIFCVLNNYSNAQDYWQQEVNYKIDVRLDDKKHELLAEETIEYINNSPDELTEIYMHLWPNAYKDNSTALVKQKLENGSTKLYYAEEEDRGFIDQLDFKVNGQTVKWDYDPEHIDICKIILNKPLKSGERMTISTTFHVKTDPVSSMTNSNAQRLSKDLDRNSYHSPPMLWAGQNFAQSVRIWLFPGKSHLSSTRPLSHPCEHECRAWLRRPSVCQEYHWYPPEYHPSS